MNTAIKNFLSFAVTKATNDAATIKDALGKKLPYSMYDGVFFFLDKELLELESNCYTRLFSGKKGFSEAQISKREIARILYRGALAQFLTTIDQTSNCLKEIEAVSAGAIEYIVPNNILLLENDVHSYSIGPVSCLHTKDLSARLANKPKDLSFSSSPDRHGLELDGAKKVFKLPSQVFAVRLNCSPESAKAEAAWRIDIATSLYRLYTIQIGHTYGVYPYWAETEPSYNQPSILNNIAIEAKSTGFTLHSGSLLPHYSVHSSTVARLSETDFNKVCERVFHPDDKTIQPSLQRALGWMAKARRADDMATKFLFFFTALEALLSQKDPTSPIIDSIARHVSVLMAKPRLRYSIYRQVKELYEIRSELVHSGYREVSPSECEVLQKITETVCVLSLKHLIDMEEKSFHALLRRHSVDGTSMQDG